MKLTLRILMLLSLNGYALNAQVTGLAGWNIVIDPGHSRYENVGVYGYSEAQRNVRVALALRDLLLETTDIDTVYLSRTNDQQSVSLSQRSDYANRLGAAWFHSIHSDAGAPELNSTLLLWGQYYDRTEKIPNGGRAMAKIIVNILTRGMRTNTRGSIGDCSFYGTCTPSWIGPYLHVNRETTMPSELSEAGFHTNPKQNQLFMNAAWKRMEAKNYYWSFLKFHQLPRPFVGTCVGVIADKETGVPINGAIATLNGQADTTDTFESLFHDYSTDPNLLHNGFYYFDQLPDATLPLIVTAPGYYPDTLQVSVVDTFFTFVDVGLISKRPPTLIQTTPAAGDTNFPGWNDLIFKFSRPMNGVSVAQNLTLEPAAQLNFFWSKDLTELHLRGDSLQSETAYTVSISGQAQDIYGHLFDGNGDGIGGDGVTFQFKTGPPDMSAPKILTAYPANTARDVEPQPIVTITYDEVVDTNAIPPDYFKLERFLDHSIVTGILELQVVHKHSLFSFFPATSLFPKEIYITRLAAGLVDFFGNQTRTPGSFSFRITEQALTYTPIDDFSANLNQNWWSPQQSGSTVGIITEKTSRTLSTRIVNRLSRDSLALQLNYGWEPSANEWLIRLYLGGAPREVLFDRDDLLQIYIFGDGSGHQFRFCIDDNYPNTAATNHEVSPWYTIDWYGWRLVTWNMAQDGTGQWIGDGNLDGILRFDSIQLTRNTTNPVSGTLYLDDLRLAHPPGTAVTDFAPVLPNEYALAPNYPNPFNAATQIHYQLAGAVENVRLVIYDVLGKPVRTLVNTVQAAGVYQVSWDGKDAAGNAVASGAYFYELTTPHFTRTRQMVLVR
ncbi:N-acetylmuramoyl-L-alanine amidase [candidate division KSB1 bacterium]|nr:N-acetylmuramoyl-L-alanine amidase [candidate division KSB1 bacterium]